MPRRVAFACDHAAFHCHETIIGFIRSAGDDIEVSYLGPTDGEAVDYPDFAAKVCAAVTAGEAEVGVLICGTGIGMSIAANKVHGVRAALCHDHTTASLARQHNNANVVCAGERVVTPEVMKDILTTFLTTPFSNAERHANRIAKVTAMEQSA